MRDSRALKLNLVLIQASLISIACAQPFESVPVNLNDFWNADGWARENDPLNGFGVDASNKRILVSSLPDNVIPGQVNLSEDGEVAFLLPEMNVGDSDAYYPSGDTIPVPSGNYNQLYLVLMSGSGTWGQPFEVNNWGPDTDPNTFEVLDARSDLNSFRPIYSDGEGDWIPIEPVNDWFWPVTEKVVPASGDPNEIVLEYLAYDTNTKGSFYLSDELGKGGHNGGQYSLASGDGSFFTYRMDGLSGLTEATLWLEIWGNSKISISTDDQNFTEIFNSVTSDQAYPDGGRRFYPNRQLKDFDLAPYLAAGDVEQIFLQFEDADPDIGWGARLRYAGIFTGPTEKVSSGSQVWPGLIRDDGSFPNPDPGGLVMIKRRYTLDESRTLQSIVMPDNTPRTAPILSVFAMTLARDQQGVTNLMAGDADQDLDFDQTDLVRVQIAAKYLTGQAATWGDGDWNGAPGGQPGNPPPGDGLFDQVDIVAALNANVYLSGPYAAIAVGGTRGDGQTSVVYDPGTGEVAVDAPAGVELTSINIDSAAGVFTGQPAGSLGGSFDNDSDNNIFKATFGGSFGSISFGNVAQSGLSETFVSGDLTVVGSLAGGGDLGAVDLIYVPEPLSGLLLAMGAALGLKILPRSQWFNLGAH